MTQANQRNSGNTDQASVKIHGHSRIIYWWPVWLFGFVLAAINSGFGDKELFERLTTEGASWHTVLSLCYLSLILFIIVITNVRAHPRNALLIVLACAVMLLLMYLGLNDKIFPHVPALLVFVNVKFLLIFSACLFIIWLVVITVIDPRYYSEVKSGELVHSELLKGHGVTLEEVVIRMKRDDWCHFILGLGMFGDVEIGKPNELKSWEDVFMVSRKVEEARNIKRLATGGR